MSRERRNCWWPSLETRLSMTLGHCPLLLTDHTTFSHTPQAVPFTEAWVRILKYASRCVITALALRKIVRVWFAQ